MLDVGTGCVKRNFRRRLMFNLFRTSVRRVALIFLVMARVFSSLVTVITAVIRVWVLVPLILMTKVWLTPILLNFYFPRRMRSEQLALKLLSDVCVLSDWRPVR